jgi:hypothetical protein
MFSFKQSLLALVGLFVIVATIAALLPLISLGQVTPGPKQPPPSFGRPGNFYLTKTKHNGAQALTACAAGYHMPSIWEIHDPSNLKYTWHTVHSGKTTQASVRPPLVAGFARGPQPIPACLYMRTATRNRTPTFDASATAWHGRAPIPPISAS